MKELIKTLLVTYFILFSIVGKSYVGLNTSMNDSNNIVYSEQYTSKWLETPQIGDGFSLKEKVNKTHCFNTRALFGSLMQQLEINSTGKLIGYKMVDGNQFGLVIELPIGYKTWFFENELTEIM